MNENALKEWAEKWIVAKLDPECCCYHHLDHAREVAAEVDVLARHAGVPEHTIALMRTAGYLHDAGYALSKEDHEAESIRIAREQLPGFGYTPEDIGEVVRFIEATRFPHRVSAPLEALIADADLGVLGRNDFPETSASFRREMAANGEVFTDLEFWRYERDFLRNFRYNSDAGRELRSGQLQRNLAWVEQQIERLEKQEDAAP